MFVAMLGGRVQKLSVYLAYETGPVKLRLSKFLTNSFVISLRVYQPRIHV